MPDSAVASYDGTCSERNKNTKEKVAGRLFGRAVFVYLAFFVSITPSGASSLPFAVSVSGPWVIISGRSAGKEVTWLILPVVICLSQRLSHACLSINNFIL